MLVKNYGLRNPQKIFWKEVSFFGPILQHYAHALCVQEKVEKFFTQDHEDASEWGWKCSFAIC